MSNNLKYLIIAIIFIILIPVALPLYVLSALGEWIYNNEIIVIGKNNPIKPTKTN